MRKTDRRDVRFLATHLLHCSEIKRLPNEHSSERTNSTELGNQAARIEYLAQEVYLRLFNDIGLIDWLRPPSGEAEDGPQPEMLYPDANGSYHGPELEERGKSSSAR